MRAAVAVLYTLHFTSGLSTDLIEWNVVLPRRYGLARL